MKWVVIFIIISGCFAKDLFPYVYSPLPVGSVKPSGWLLNQLNIEANGLAGYLADFWPDIANSTWIGGNVNDPGGLNERVPYWLNGAVPLAYMTKNQHLLNQVIRYVDYIIEHQDADGWLGPICCDPWPRFPLLLALTQYVEANSSATNTVVPALRKFFHGLKTVIDKNPLSSWAQYRWQDLVLSIWWMYENQPGGEEQFLLSLAQEVQSQGFNWTAFIEGPNFPKDACTGNCRSLATHGVNVGQGIKDEAVWFRFSGNPSAHVAAQNRMSILDTYHGQSSGIFSCSEHLAGLNPSQGSETCTVVETMYSYEINFAVFGDMKFAERFEQLAYNALPAALTPDMWAHVYLQQANQINSKHCDPFIWVSDGPDSNIYGLEPNYGCCTANFPQGWPKFVTNLFMKTQDNGLAAVAYGPSEVHTTIKGGNVDILLETNYPFDDTLVFNINSQVSFPFYMKISSWAKSPSYQIGNNDPVNVAPGQFAKVNCNSGITKITLKLPMDFSINYRLNNSISISRGPLVYSLMMDEKWTQTRHYAFNSYDYVIAPTTPWNYALNIDPNNPGKYLQFVQGTVGKVPFSPLSSPVKVLAKGRLLQSWVEQNNAANIPPHSPVTSSAPLVDITLLPFGAGQLRVSDLPYLQNPQ